MLNLAAALAADFSLEQTQVARVLALFDEGGTVPFIARYRKERTGGLDEVVLRSLQERAQYLTALEARKATILKSIDEQGRLTDALRKEIAACMQKNLLEDLYLPYKPRRRTRATQAREKGLEPLAAWIMAQNEQQATPVNLRAAARPYVDAEREVHTVEDALQGASDILAESVAERAALRAYVRDAFYERGRFVSSVDKKHAEGSTNYEMYRSFSVPAKKIAAHNLLALLRGEREGVLSVRLEVDEDALVAYLCRQVIRTPDAGLRRYLQAMTQDAFARLMKNTLSGEVRQAARLQAEEASIQAFAANLRALLLASPAGMRPTLGVDPGFRTGCKLAVLDETGRLLAHRTIYPHTGADARKRAAEQLREAVRTHRVELVAIGNGTGGRETEAFVRDALAEQQPQPTAVMVNEAGASVYSASPVAIAEFPDLDVTIRGAISIGRRLQDPLAELVKIEPRSIGVGQYQHDVDQGRLKQKLDETVESCVNYVGVDLNTASAALLRFVAGITPSLAESIIAHRDREGAFADRASLMAVRRFGPKAFEQAAGFLRIRQGTNPLDNTAVHPEAYPVVEAMAGDLGVTLPQITGVPEQLGRLDLKRYTTPAIGIPTLRDILAELEKPGRDPREAFQYAAFREDVQAIGDLKVGMVLEGVVTNVANFGAFVDVGVHRDGLVHISQLADRYVADPHTLVQVGQVVQVRVLEVNQKLGRISLSMRSEGADAERPKRRTKRPKPKGGAKKKKDEAAFTVDDLVKKFNKR